MTSTGTCDNDIFQMEHFARVEEQPGNDPFVSCTHFLFLVTYNPQQFSSLVRISLQPRHLVMSTSVSKTSLSQTRAKLEKSAASYVWIMDRIVWLLHILPSQTPLEGVALLVARLLRPVITRSITLSSTRGSGMRMSQLR